MKCRKGRADGDDGNAKRDGQNIQDEKVGKFGTQGHKFAIKLEHSSPPLCALFAEGMQPLDAPFHPTRIVIVGGTYFLGAYAQTVISMGENVQFKGNSGRREGRCHFPPERHCLLRCAIGR